VTARTGTSQIEEYKDQLVKIVRRLPEDRAQQLVDFARFLEFQTSGEFADRIAQEEESEEQWDELLARPDSQKLLREMAREAREDYAAGRTTGIIETDEGELGPE
jgi:hypothetical protein